VKAIDIELLKARMKVFELTHKATIDVLVVTHQVQKAMREHPKFIELSRPNTLWRSDQSIEDLLGIPIESYGTEKEAITRTWKLMTEGKRVGLQTDPKGQFTRWRLPLDQAWGPTWDIIGIEDIPMSVMPPRTTMIRHVF